MVGHFIYHHPYDLGIDELQDQNNLKYNDLLHQIYSD